MGSLYKPDKTLRPTPYRQWLKLAPEILNTIFALIGCQIKEKPTFHNKLSENLEKLTKLKKIIISCLKG